MRNFTLLLFALLFQSCGDEEPANFILPNAPIDQMAILGFLGNNEIPLIEVSAIAPFSNDEFDPNITEALPILWENGIPIDTFRYVLCTICDRRLNGAYVGDTVRLENGATYQLTISAPNYETSTVSLPEFRQVFSNNQKVTLDTTHTPTGVQGVRTLVYEIENDINIGYIDDIQTNSEAGLTSSVSGFFDSRPTSIWRLMEFVSTGRPGPFASGSVDSLSFPFITPFSPEEFNQRLADNLVNYNIYAVHMTDEYAEAIREYLNNTARELPGGAFINQQLLVSNVENGFGYVLMVDMVGGRAMLR